MSSINKLNQGTPTVASLIPFYDQANGRDASCSVTQLAALILAGLSSSGFVTQYSSPNASGYAVTVAPPTPGMSVWLLLTPLASYAALNITLPAGTDGQEVLVFSTQAVTGALAITTAVVGSGQQPANGVPATLAVNGFFRLKFNAVNGSWYRVA